MIFLSIKNSSEYIFSRLKISYSIKIFFNSFSTWLFRIATNNTIDFIRKKRLKTTSLNTSFTDDSGKNINIDVKDLDKTPGEEAIHKQKIMLVRKFVSMLPDKYENLIKYRYFDELSYNEIA